MEAAWRQVTQIASPDLLHDLRRKFKLPAIYRETGFGPLYYANRESERSFGTIIEMDFDTRFREFKIVLDSSRSRHLPWMRAVRNIRTVRILLDLYFSRRLRESRSTMYRESKTRHGACHLARNFVPRAMMQQTTRTLNCIRILWAQHRDSLACSSSSSHFAQRDTSLDLSIYDREHSLHIRVLTVFKRSIHILTRMNEKRTEAKN
jgi:hypothetical protein